MRGGLSETLQAGVGAKRLSMSRNAEVANSITLSGLGCRTRSRGFVRRRPESQNPGEASSMIDVPSPQPVVPSFDRSLLRDIEQTLPLKHFPKGQAIHNIGSESLVMLVPTEGRFLITRVSDEGKRLVTFAVHVGSAFVRLTEETSNGSSIEALAQEPSSAFMLSRSILKDLVASKPAFAWNVIELMSSWIDVIEGKLETQAYYPIQQRLAGLLSRLSASTDEVHLSHQRLAEGVGASREAVTRTLDGFRQEGLVQLSRTSITILDRERLQRFSSEHGASAPRAEVDQRSRTDVFGNSRLDA